MLCDPYAAPFFEGVFAADTLPRTLKTRPSLVLANCDNLGKAGSHWVAFFIGSDRKGEFFDSYGLPPIIESHRAFLQRTCTSWKHNTTCLQSLNSTVCGIYCASFLLHRARGVSLHDFVNNNFKSPWNCKSNDNTVRTLYRKFANNCKKPCIVSHYSTIQQCYPRRKQFVCQYFFKSLRNKNCNV